MPYGVQNQTIQWAREATAGLDLPATSKLGFVEEFNINPASMRQAPSLLKGLMARNRGNETPVKHFSEWDLTGKVSFEQLQHLLCMVENVAAPSGASPYIWEHVKNPAAFPAPATYTFEYRDTDGATPIDKAIHYALLQSLTLSGADEELISVEANGVGRKIQTETITAALTAPTMELHAPPLCRVWINDTWAAIGTTLLTSQVLGWSHQLNCGVVPVWTMDNRADMDYLTHSFDANEISVALSITCLVGPQFAIEKAAARAQTLRAVRIQLDGTAGRQLQIDTMAKYEVPDLGEFGDENGMRIVVLNLAESAGDSVNLVRYKLTNLVATLV